MHGENSYDISYEIENFSFILLDFTQSKIGRYIVWNYKYCFNRVKVSVKENLQHPKKSYDISYEIENHFLFYFIQKQNHTIYRMKLS